MSALLPELAPPDEAYRLDEAALAVALVAAQHADAVDRDARCPVEAIEAMRARRLLGAMVPTHLGGAGASLADVASACSILGRACASSAMVFAMHQIQVACIVDHAADQGWHRLFLQQLVRHQWLLASATSEDGVGGNLRTSQCALETNGGEFRLRKAAPAISYGDYADGILATARRDADAPASEQVLVTLLRDGYTLTRRNEWDTLGLRGTCSNGFVLEAQGATVQCAPVPFAQIAEQTMVPVSHILWAAVWIGVAGDAFQRAHQFFRAQARQSDGAPSPAARRIAESLDLMQAMQARVDSVLRLYGCASARSWSAGMAWAAEVNTLKTYVSTAALEVVQQAMMICGMAGYKNGTPYSVGRHLRDLQAAPLMISNDRIAANTSNLLLALRPSTLEKLS
ncbi:MULTISPECIES: acyl-CoA dehydrogenase family protein [Burkholderia]|uniref:Acyl-CoA dehydrogenase, type 2, C-terminal domain protein n=2 Tax=Burkholderia vietnamiensis TaxID=60552 RepID=A4JN86_BURVG|nr:MULTISPECIES: acyl-CoA dehydrogenase family protein [Burkholderia]ABO57739.1 Acyl-CoA dehydrogenase, type 2, C-terminal domain protein [Burkholderia vietnamiensis G4]KVE08235.1 acyl-CoA dehydrogenase [Burkholderia vietnamiensis]KVE22495.1 acyl-CoA dehydrogenase [Burkholderia vietnamiensis]KVF12796.1 acyl-CoA dehydrogenase [Burkholderia vietnamiensis]KVF39928.1 acyl-CoA dehydrogenase [Burkholderia vietnamiensis]